LYPGNIGSFLGFNTNSRVFDIPEISVKERRGNNTSLAFFIDTTPSIEACKNQ
jgi:hypothetical protein